MEGDAKTAVGLTGQRGLPILQKADGSHLRESLDIVRYIDELGAPMFDGPPDEAIDAWCADAWPVAMKLFIPRSTKADFAEAATPEARKAYVAREEKALGDMRVLLKDTPAYVQQMNPKLEALAPLLEMHEVLDISDIKLWPILRCLSIVNDLHFSHAVLRYMTDLSDKAHVPLMFDQAM
jgi:glutaredoxin 2